MSLSFTDSELFKLSFERWEVLGNDLPNNLQVQTEIVVDYSIAESGKQPPWHVRLLSNEFLRQLP